MPFEKFKVFDPFLSDCNRHLFFCISRSSHTVLVFIFWDNQSSFPSSPILTVIGAAKQLIERGDDHAFQSPSLFKMIIFFPNDELWDAGTISSSLPHMNKTSQWKRINVWGKVRPILAVFKILFPRSLECSCILRFSTGTWANKFIKKEKRKKPLCNKTSSNLNIDFSMPSFYLCLPPNFMSCISFLLFL